MKKNNFIIYECTVYPGLIEEVCIPIINKISKLELNKDYFVAILQKESILVIKDIH